MLASISGIHALVLRRVDQWTGCGPIHGPDPVCPVGRSVQPDGSFELPLNGQPARIASLVQVVNLDGNVLTSFRKDTP
jgi:hypothetical protein